MKKILSLILCLCMTLSLTACSARETEEFLDAAIPIAVAVLEEMEAMEAAGESVVVPPVWQRLLQQQDWELRLLFWREMTA